MTLAEQLIAARIPRPAAQAQQDDARDRKLTLLEWMCRSGRNVTMAEAASAMGVALETARIWLRELKAERRVMSFHNQRKLWWAPTPAELHRRKQWTF